MTATAPQIAAIHTLARKAGMGEDVRRDFMERVAGVRSCKSLSGSQAIAVIDNLKRLTDAGAAKGAVAGLTSPAAKKLRALWIAGYDLGMVRDRSDRAMLALLERQTGVSHTRFLNEPGQATSAIEALKSWLKRDGKVEWPAREAWKRDGKADFDEIAANKWAVIEAQWRKAGIRSTAHDSPSAYAFYVAGRFVDSFELHHYDQVQKALGVKVRAVIAKAGRS